MMIEVAIRDIYEEYNVWILDYGRDRCIKISALFLF